MLRQFKADDRSVLEFWQADLVFRHQVIWDGHQQRHLTDLPDANAVVGFLGTIRQDIGVAKGIALGMLHPETLEPFVAPVAVPQKRLLPPPSPAVLSSNKRPKEESKGEVKENVRPLQRLSFKTVPLASDLFKDRRPIVSFLYSHAVVGAAWQGDPAVPTGVCYQEQGCEADDPPAAPAPKEPAIKQVC